MGAHLNKPVVQKHTEACEGKHNGLRFGASAMQGYRKEMEDAHAVMADVPGLLGHSFVAVYDGHGGDKTALLARQEMLKCITMQPEFSEYSAGNSKSDLARQPPAHRPMVHRSRLQHPVG